MWFGTYGGGLNRLHEGQITVYTTALGEYNNRAWCIHEDADGVFWVGSRGGLNRFVPPGVKWVVPALAGQATAWRGPSSTLEVQPAKAGTTNADRFFTFTTRHGLHENTINNVQEDDFGYLWLSGLQGIYRVSRGELNEIAMGRQTQAQVLALGEVDGLLNSQCNGGINQPSGCKDRAGRIWFPTARGVAMIDPRNIHRNEVPPPVVIEQVLADNQVVLGDGRPSRPGDASRGPRLSPTMPEANVLRLAPGRARVLEIHYTGNSFAAPNRMRFKYRLEGYDQDWRYDDQNRRVAFYTSLWPGAYTFHVLACNNHGVWSETAAQFSFILAPHFWQTWLFYVLAGAGILGLAAALQAYRLRWQHRLLKLEHQQALADERTRIARDLHDDLGTALTGLALELDVARRDAGTATTLTQRLADAAGHTRGLAERMREVVWAVNPRCDNVPSVASVLEQLASQFLDAAEIRVRLEFPGGHSPAAVGQRGAASTGPGRPGGADERGAACGRQRSRNEPGLRGPGTHGADPRQRPGIHAEPHRGAASWIGELARPYGADRRELPMGFRCRGRDHGYFSCAARQRRVGPRDSRMSIRVAIVEDDRLVRENLAVLIDAAPGFRCVATCPSAEDALNRLPGIAPDVVLMDIHLPGRSGIECVARLRPLLPLTQVIMLTVEENTELIFESLKAGATGYFVKHVPADEILAAISQVHRGGAPMSSHIARLVVTAFRQASPSVGAEARLTPREEDILRLLAKGHRSKEIADELGIATGTVNTHVRHIYEKLHVRSRAEAVARFVRGSP